MRWPEREADGREQLGWRGTALLLFGRCWGRMEERPGDGNERVREFCCVKEKGRVKGRWGNVEEAALVWEKKLEMRAVLAERGRLLRVAGEEKAVGWPAKETVMEGGRRPGKEIDLGFPFCFLNSPNWPFSPL